MHAGSEPTGELVRRLLADVAALLSVYRREIRDHLEGLGRDLAAAGIMLAAALALGLFSLGVAVAALILVADVWLPAWVAALLVLGVMVAVIGVLVLLAVRRIRRRAAGWSARVSEEVRWLRSLFQSKS